MTGTIRWNFIFGIIGFILIVIISMNNNVLSTSLIRGLYSFVILFVFCFAIRWALGTFGEPDHTPDLHMDDEFTGNNVNAVTPDEEASLNQLLKENLASPIGGSFSPLVPPKLTTKEQQLPMEQLTEVVRYLSKEGES